MENERAAEPKLTFVDSLGGEIEYMAHSTVSKTLLRAEGVNVVLFSFAAGEELSEHTAAMPVLVQVLEGELEVSANGETVTLRPGGLVHFETRLAHAVKATVPTKMVLYMLPPAGRCKKH